jgi:hypothetical protein
MDHSGGTKRNDDGTVPHALTAFKRMDRRNSHLTRRAFADTAARHQFGLDGRRFWTQ